MNVSDQIHAPATFPPGKARRCLLNRMLGELQSGSGLSGEDKNLFFLSGFEPHTVHPVAQLLYWLCYLRYCISVRLQIESALQSAVSIKTASLAPWNWILSAKLTLIQSVNSSSFYTTRRPITTLTILQLICNLNSFQTSMLYFTKFYTHPTNHYTQGLTDGVCKVMKYDFPWKSDLWPLVNPSDCSVTMPATLIHLKCCACSYHDVIDR
jgi:hypothetical protein